MTLSFAIPNYSATLWLAPEMYLYDFEWKKFEPYEPPPREEPAEDYEMRFGPEYLTDEEEAYVQSSSPRISTTASASASLLGRSKSVAMDGYEWRTRAPRPRRCPLEPLTRAPLP
jgi:hypothetical protein